MNSFCEAISHSHHMRLTAFMPDVIIPEETLQGASSPSGVWRDLPGCDCEGAILTKKCTRVSLLKYLIVSPNLGDCQLPQIAYYFFVFTLLFSEAMSLLC